MIRLSAEGICKNFNHRQVIRDVSFELTSGESLSISGPNGSGKTTLLRILCGLLAPTRGSIEFYDHRGKISVQNIFNYIGFVGPYLQLYNQLTAWENMQFFSKMRGLKRDGTYFRSIMQMMGLAGREMDELKTYSSGMLQRMKYVIALLHQPEVLILDEPTSNLDESGVQIVYQIMEKQKKDKLLIIATNDPEEVRFGQKHVRLGT